LPVLLIRHCQTTGQSLDSPLTERGREQAQSLTHTLQQRFAIDRIVSSPYLRARDTIAPFALQKGIELEIDERLRERRLTDGYMEPADEWLAAVEASFADLKLRLPGGESGEEALARGWAALQDALASGFALPALVSHGQLISHLLTRIDPSFGFEDWQALATPDVYVIEQSPEGRLRFERVSLD
jgi:2,3-bisphosphoglycerate-dependent phosphoglycerate mutase